MACQSGDIGMSPMHRLLWDDPSLMPVGTPQTPYVDHVPMRYAIKYKDVSLCVLGNAPRVYTDGDGGYVVEVCGRVGKSRSITQVVAEVDMAMLCTYGYMLARSKQLERVTLKVLFQSSLSLGEVKGNVRTYPMRTDQLKDMFEDLVCRVYDRLAYFLYVEKVLRPKARRAVFPYQQMREAQEDMIRECLRDMRHGQKIFAQAPTGIGKTISTLYPALRCFGEDRCDKIFYLTAKAATRREAISAMEKLVSAGTKVRTVVLSAKFAMCASHGIGIQGGASSRCTPQKCMRAKGYYDKVGEVISHLLQSDTAVFTYSVIKAAADAAGICPYELSLDLSAYCQVIICDYNYVFSPGVYLKRYFSEGIPHSEGHRYIFLVDEAHNLAERARDMYSGYLSLAQLKVWQDILQNYEDTITRQSTRQIFPLEDDENPHCPKQATLEAKDLDDLLGELSRMARFCEQHMTGEDGVRRGAELTKQLPDVLSAVACDLYRRTQSWLHYHDGHPLTEAVESLRGVLQSFVTAAMHYDKNFATLIEVEGENVSVCLTCLDPSSLLAPRIRWCEAGIFFSATLTPADYFADILGGGKDSVCVSFDSPFPKENLCVVVCDSVNTRFEGREKSYQRVVNHIAATASARRGNYMVYFSSYSYLEEVQKRFVKKYPRIRLYVQKPEMSMQEKEDFIHAFTGQTDKLQIGFCVLGGSFSEGLDLPGDALIGVIVVGVGIPGLSSERNIIKNYYDEKREGEGYAYAYTYPGMNHVLQAAGRVIRRQEDRGVVVLLDDRYATPPYIQMFPEHWGNPKLASDAERLCDILRRFWEEELPS